jgi:hypothetical protein
LNQMKMYTAVVACLSSRACVEWVTEKQAQERRG